MKFEIITPEKSFFKADVNYVYAPGEAGYFGVLKNHSPFLTTLKDGKVKIILPDDSEKEFTVSGGFADVKDNTVTILAESVTE